MEINIVIYILPYKFPYAFFFINSKFALHKVSNCKHQSMEKQHEKTYQETFRVSFFYAGCGS